MDLSRTKGAMCATVLFAVGLLVGAVQANEQPQSADLSVPQAQEPVEKPPVFSAQEMKVFVAAVAKAEQISDPMERCLHFPDPPGSHWSHDGLVAYCHYVLQPTMSVAEFDRLIQSGHAKEVDQRFAAWEADPKKHPDAFFYFLVSSLSETGPEQHPLLESWKRQSPHSAFAYAASGWRYTDEGWAARGGKPGVDTPQSNLDAMQDSMERARGDLAMAIRLDPKLAAAYATMVDIGTALDDKAYVAQAEEQGLHLAGSTYPVFMNLTRYTSSRWHGNARTQHALLDELAPSLPKEPLLHVVRAVVLSYDANIDYGAPGDGDWSVYRRALDDVSTHGLLHKVGIAALNHDQFALAYVYLSEAARFDTTDQEAMDARARAASEIAPVFGAN